jgi:DNA-binding beta-propeller fold protein YncE
MTLSRYSLISFVAMLALAGCGGSSSTTTPPPPTIGKLYVAVANADTILRFPAGANGDASPEARFPFPRNGPTFIALDVPHNRMAISSNDGPPAVTLFDNVSQDGSAPRVIAGAATTMTAVGRCALDTTNDLLYVAADQGPGTSAVLVFGPASTVLGNIAPLRTFTTGFVPTGFVLDSANNRLFLANQANNSIAIFDNASTLTGPVTPTRTISGANTQLNSPFDMVLDNSGRLIVTSSFSVNITGLLVFANAGVANGNVAPAASSQITQGPLQMAISPAGELYVVDGDIRVTVYGNVATASGAIHPIRVIQGPDTGLNFVMPSIPGLPAGVALDPTR